MIIIKPSYEILSIISEGGIEELKFIEKIGRVCYKSEDRISENVSSALTFAEKIIARGHEAMLEHSSLSVKFIVDRGVSHEIVRHRIASYAQESTRYCNYSKDKFGNEITFIIPEWLDLTPGLVENAMGDWYFDDVEVKVGKEEDAWLTSMDRAEHQYMKLSENGWQPQQARSVLPNSLKTEIVMTANYREWRNFFKLRVAATAHPQMREVTIPLLKELQKKIPVIFEDIAL